MSSARSPRQRQRHWIPLGLILGTTSGLALAAGLWAQPNAYVQHDLTSDGAQEAEHVDKNLVNPWGVAFNPFGFAWVADNGTGRATPLDGNGKPQAPIVTIPTPPGDTGDASPTGVVFNGSEDFVIHQGSAEGPSRFIFATEQGTLGAWSPDVDRTHAILVVDNSGSDAVYKGLALAGNGEGLHLYATDFHHGRIDVFDRHFSPVHLEGSFVDPSLPDGFAPFGIHTLQGNLYVTYARQDEERHDDVKGKGLGFVSVFDANGHFLRRLISQGKLNAPWGIALAPADFGSFSNRLLVGNFGDGTINAYDLATGHAEGSLESPDGTAVRIDGLWGMAFGNGVNGQPGNALFFAAGPQEEAHGVFGRLDAVPTTEPTPTPDRLSPAPAAQ
ncbi:TIGR03118 family protein [Myxococcaceae bacterium JPH2]|nr:TIGR03118 family protein [Myxococcaceae bacterium JPH2]